ncbi:MAG: Fe-S cluster assembly transcriptional regulator IscR [Burkholderia sp.]
MKLTTKGRFAVTAMVDLAINQADAPVSLAQISERQRISVAYLEQIFCKLRRAGLVESYRGPGGGYRLGEAGGGITVGQIIEAVDEDIDATQCKGDGSCNGGASCLTHHLWESLNSVTKKFLDGVTLDALVKANERRSGRQTVPAVIPVRGKAQGSAAEQQ